MFVEAAFPPKSLRSHQQVSIDSFARRKYDDYVAVPKMDTGRAEWIKQMILQNKNFEELAQSLQIYRNMAGETRDMNTLDVIYRLYTKRTRVAQQRNSTEERKIDEFILEMINQVRSNISQISQFLKQIQQMAEEMDDELESVIIDDDTSERDLQIENQRESEKDGEGVGCGGLVESSFESASRQRQR